MKIILHMGQPKTGTTSLQASLHAASGVLRSHGVLYPQFGHGFIAHHLLVALCAKPTLLPTWMFEELGGAESAVQVARRAWDLTCEEIRRDRPEILVLSSEFLVHHIGSTEKARLSAMLTEISGDITPVIYVRHPVDLYRARLQQHIKHRDEPFQIVNPQLKEAMLASEVAFARKPELVAFDRKVLLGGDVVHDFAVRFLSPQIKAGYLPTKNSNVGLSAEATVLMVQLRAEAGGTYEAARRLDRLVPLLVAFDQSDPPAQPLTLLPEVAEAVLRSSTSYRWLAETGQLEIPGLDVTKIDDAPVPDWIKTAAPETLFLHDPERLERLRDAVRELHTVRYVLGRPVDPLAYSKPRLRDLLLRFLQQKLASQEGRNTGAAPSGASSAGRSSQGDRNDDT